VAWVSLAVQEKTMGVRSHGSEGLMTLTDLVLTPFTGFGKYFCLLIFVSARTSDGL
jgi:hypothetical protein